MSDRCVRLAILFLAICLSPVTCFKIVGGGVVLPNLDQTDLPGCWVAKMKILMYIGEVETLKDHCLQMQCNNDLSIKFTSCPPTEVPQACSLMDYNMTLSFPECCPQVDCSKSSMS